MPAGRILFLLLAFFLLTTIRASGPTPGRGRPADAILTALPVSLSGSDPRQRRIGGLLFRRGWALSSDDIRFGGISAMQVANGRVIAVSDAGFMFEFGLPESGRRSRVRIAPLADGRLFWRRPSSRDSESLVLHGDRAWIGFESVNGIVRYRRLGWRPEAGTRPPSMRGWRANSGPEAMVRLADGRFLVFSEGRANGAPTSAAVLFDGDPAEPATRAEALRYRRPEGFRVTDAALLPDGRLLILHRRFSWLSGISAKLVVADLSRLGPGAEIGGREIAELRSPLTVDNMEALSVTREGGRTIVRIASDDNYMAIQRSLLLEFELAD